jgi:hypothetical protein
VCPAGATCKLDSAFNANALVSVFNSGGLDRLFDLGGVLASKSCTAALSGCGENTGIITITPPVNDPIASLCNYDASDLGVLAKVQCWTTVTVN